MNMLPLILLTLVITMFSAVRFAASMNVETKSGPVNLCHTVVTLYDTAYEGDYHIEDDGDVVYMVKGEHLLDGDFSIIDSIEAKTGVDITIFNRDTRVVTTIQSSDGVRAIGTKANDTAFGLTMSFGITEGNDGKVEHIVRDADAKLYEGKNNDRNRIVYEAT